jgi:hypothetical protein
VLRVQFIERRNNPGVDRQQQQEFWRKIGCVMVNREKGERVKKSPPGLWGRGGRSICLSANYVRTGTPVHKQQQMADFVPICPHSTQGMETLQEKKTHSTR